MFQGMRRIVLLGFAVFAVAVMAPSAAMAMKPPHDVTCPEYKENDPTDSTVYQGTAKDLLVPEGHECVVYGADITKNVTAEKGSFLGIIQATIGHNLISNGALAVYVGVYQTEGGKGPGPVTVGHDILLNGSSDNLDFCDTTVVHDFIVNNVKNAYELQIGDSSQEDLDYTDDFYSCQGGPEFSLSPPVTVNHNLTITNSSFGLLDVANDKIGRNLTVDNDTATYENEGYLPAGQGMWVDSDTIGRNASCVGDTPALASSGPGAQPNQAGKEDTCTF